MAEKRSFLETMSEQDRPESFAEEKFVRVKNSGMKKWAGGGIAAVVVLAGIFAVLYFSGRVTMPNLVGKTLVEATDWATKNNITLYAKNTYSKTVDADTILTQETEAGKSVKKNTTVSIGVSLGSDPEEAIPFPDIKNMTSSEITTWISDNKLTGARIVTAYSDVVKVNQVISYAFTDGSEDNFKRKNRVNITVSLGSETLSSTVVIADFSAMKAGAVLQWGADNGITITIEQAFDNYISSGNVISQSVKANTEVLRASSVTVVISIGKAVKVPDLTSMTTDDANAWAKLNNVTLSITNKYSETREKGKLYNQNTAVGASIKEGDVIKLDCSLGKVQITSFIGKTKIDILNWQSDVNTKYANIKLVFADAYGEKGSAGKITGQSVQNDYIGVGTTVTAYISKGMKIVMPDFAGKTEAECRTIANGNGMSLLFDYQDSESISKGFVISQSIPENTIITDAQSVTVVISIKE